MFWELIKNRPLDAIVGKTWDARTRFHASRVLRINPPEASPYQPPVPRRALPPPRDEDAHPVGVCCILARFCVISTPELLLW